MYKDEIDEKVQEWLGKGKEKDAVAAPVAAAEAAKAEPVTFVPRTPLSVDAVVPVPVASEELVEPKKTSTAWKVAGIAALGVVGIAAAAVIARGHGSTSDSSTSPAAPSSS